MARVNKGFGSKCNEVAVWAVFVLLFVSFSQRAGAVEVRQFANGISATIYTPTEILDQMKSDQRGSNIGIQTPNGVVEILGEANGMVPFELEYVAGALADMAPVATGVDVTVYILPTAPVAAGSSFARQDAIFLAPGTGDVDESTVAYIATHEMGHVLTWAFMDRQPSRWASYMQIRGLDTDTNGPQAIHADRAREILAEDIRFLFGGPNATWPGSIENHYLTLPDHVDGLAELLAGFFMTRDPAPALAASSVFPNPCNPLTTVAMKIPAGVVAESSEAVLRIFDIRGALVTTVKGGKLANNRVTVQWRGKTASGGAAASGRYMYVLRAGGLVAKGTVTLVR